MSENNTCGNGHIYEPGLSDCPYCPSQTVVEGATAVETNEHNKSEKFDKTEVLSQNPGDRTVIHQADSNPSELKSENNSGRKLVAWLVTFSWDKLGQDYRIFEGKTLIGADSNCDITIGDGEVSGHHATLLFRGGVFRIKDEFSTNGTIVNDQEIVDQLELKDGDSITLGKTEFLFRSI